MDLALLFANFKNFVNLTSEEEALIRKHSEYSTHKKGEIISEAGSICRYTFYVLSGCARIYFTDKDGNEHTIAFSKEDWWTGDLRSFTQNVPADYSVQCLEDSEIVRFSSEKLESLFSAIPKLERFFRLLIQRAYASSQNRLVQNLSLTAKERYYEFLKKHPKLEQRIPQYLIASYLGITKEFMSKLKKEVAHER